MSPLRHPRAPAVVRLRPATVRAGLAARVGAVLLGAALAGGCAITPVAPWQKEFLADPRMALDPDRLDSRYAEHIYFSREGSSGGAGIGGGGCGCN